MTYPGLAPGARPVAAACFRAVRRRLAFVRDQERQLAQLTGFRREVAARTCARLRRETRLQLQAMRQLLHVLYDARPDAMLADLARPLAICYSPQTTIAPERARP